jgi:hypothetical protein
VYILATFLTHIQAHAMKLSRIIPLVFAGCSLLVADAAAAAAE